MEMYLEVWVLVGVWIVVIAGFFYKALNPSKKPLRSVSSPPDSAEIVGTLEDLEAAEKAVAQGSVFDHQKTIYENYERIERLHTNAGFTTDYVNEIIQSLQEQGFDAFSHWQESGFPGTYALLPIGYHEIFVAREQAEEARRFLAKR